MYSELVDLAEKINIQYIVYSLGGIFAIVSYLLKRKKYDFTIKATLFYAFFIIGMGMIELKLMGEIRSVCLSLISGGEYKVSGSVRIFGAIIFQPMLCYIVSLITGDKFRKLTDSITPETFAYFVFGKVVCFLEGCCHGIPWENGIYSNEIEQIVFPVQIYEILCSLAVTVILYVLALKSNKLRGGALFPLGTILYSIPRFVLENFRYYESHWEKDFFIRMSFWQLWCVVSIIISIVWLVLLYKKPAYAEGWNEKNPEALFPRLIQRLKNRNQKNIVHHNKRKKK